MNLTKSQHAEILKAYISRIPTDRLRRVAQSAAACEDALFEGNAQQQRLTVSQHFGQHRDYRGRTPSERPRPDHKRNQGGDRMNLPRYEAASKSEIQTPLFGNLAKPNGIDWIMEKVEPADLIALQVTLMNLRRLGPIHHNRGICGQLHDISERLGLEVKPGMWLFLQLSRHWPNYSGVSDYPVPERLESEQPASAGDHYFITNDKWDGPYGAARRDLLDWMINKLEELINER